MATRAEIRKKLGIVTLEDPSVANKELSEIDCAVACKSRISQLIGLIYKSCLRAALYL